MEKETLFEISMESSSISLEAIPYALFYRNRGVRRSAQLVTPIINTYQDFELPRGSIYHYNPETVLEMGPAETNPVYKNDKRVKFIQHVAEFQNKSPIGMYVRRPGNPQTLMTQYRNKHRSLKLLRDFSVVNKQDTMLMVINYSLINQLYKYRPHRFVNYYHFYNFYSSILIWMNHLAKQSLRQHFFEVRLPEVLHDRILMNRLADEQAKGISNRYLKYFPNAEYMLFHHLWMWIGKHRHLSLFNRLSEDVLPRINLMIKDGNNFVLLNLGELDKWRSKVDDTSDDYEVDNLDEVDEELPSGGERPQALLVKFHKLATLLQSKRISATPTINAFAPIYTDKDNEPLPEDEEIQDVPLDEEPNEQPTTPAEVTDEKQTSQPTPSTKKSDLPPLPIDDIETGETDKSIPDEGDGESELNESTDDEFVEDTGVDEDIIEDDEGEVVDVSFYKSERFQNEPEHVKPILEDAMRLLENGYITAKQYNRAVENANTYKEVPSPYRSGKTIADDLQINVEETTNIPKRTMPDNKWIIDKSMLESSTEENRTHYVKNILPKDIVRSVMSLQKAGVIVTDIRRNTYVDPASEYEVLEVDTQPINGTATTLKLKLPIINPDNGVIKSQGVSYILRNQRADKVIRKVNPTKVSLTTYYGKLNVRKSDKKVHNLEKWLHAQIQILNFNAEIDNLHYGNVANRVEKLPSIYTMIAARYHYFEQYKRDGAEIYAVFNFDYNERHRLLIKHDELERREEQEQKDEYIESLKGVVTKLEQEFGGVLFAYERVIEDNGESNRMYYFIRPDNTVYSSMKRESTIYSLLGIANEPPVELAEMKLSGKQIPLGIILGYYLGLTKLTQLLGVRPRKVFRGQRLNLTRNEYAIKFSDEVWIFDKRNYHAQLILNGLNAYKRYLGDYSAEQFESSDVYMALLRDAGISMGIENELKLLNRMFIDDISKTLLIQMKEPTEFVPLLIRAVELLTAMDSRNEINMDDMIIRGYQRIAGHVYTTLVRQVKQNMSKRMSSRERFDIPTSSVFELIRNDPATMIVDDINPIKNLKEHDDVTFGGEGGRTVRTMVGSTRAYDRSDLGTISEATVDSSKVAISTFLSANPVINSVYGVKNNDVNLQPSNILSTASLLGVGSTNDDRIYCPLL